MFENKTLKRGLKLTLVSFMMSFGQPQKKRARIITKEECEITIIKDCILESINYTISVDIAKEIAEFSQGTTFECDNCQENDAMSQCEKCRWMYCRICQDEICEKGKHCYNCTRKEFIIKCWRCQLDDSEPFTPKLCLECENDGKHKEGIYFCNTCEYYECDPCFNNGSKTSSFWECEHEGCYKAICGDCYKRQVGVTKNEWLFCKCDLIWCGKHQRLCWNCYK